MRAKHRLKMHAVLLDDTAATWMERTPLCIDLDGSLIHNDTLHDTTMALLKGYPIKAAAIPAWLRQGKAYMKRRIAHYVDIDASTLPYNDELVTWLTEQKAIGRKLVLSTAADEAIAQKIAAHLDLFDEVIASDGITNLSSRNKANALISRFGEKGFDYVGNSTVDLLVWRAARRAIVVGNARLAAKAAEVSIVDLHIQPARAKLRTWAKGLRLHQWLKNLLVFLPLVGGHRWGDLVAVAQVVLAFLCFGLTASAVYVLNDLLDLDSDRQHPRKRQRPFAAGLISVPAGLAASGCLFTAGIGLGATLGANFLFWLGAYVVLTTLYSFALKRFALIDCLALAGLYTLRIVAGGATIAQPISFWLLAFSLFLFLSLAFIKRFAELVSASKSGETKVHGRGYRIEDQLLLQSIGVVSGFASAVVMALYLNSAEVLVLYKQPQLLWFTMPVLLFWICWVWLRAARDEMHDDPVVFAARDSASLMAGALFLGVMWAAVV